MTPPRRHNDDPVLGTPTNPGRKAEVATGGHLGSPSQKQNPQAPAAPPNLHQPHAQCGIYRTIKVDGVQLCVYVCICSSNRSSLEVGGPVECGHEGCSLLSWAQGLQRTRAAGLWASGTRALADGPVWHRRRDMWCCQGCLQMLPGAQGGGGGRSTGGPPQPSSCLRKEGPR